MLVQFWNDNVKTVFFSEAVSTSGVLVDVTETSATGLAQGKQITDWSVEDVGQWTEQIGLGQYAENFRTNAIDGTELLTLQDSSLQSALKISKLRQKLL